MAIQMSASADSASLDSSERKRTGRSSLFAASKRVSGKDRLFFTEQLSLLLETGMSIVEALTLLKGHATTPALTNVVDSLIEQVSTGRTLSSAMSAHPEVFSRTYINLIAASEEGGFMHEVLEQLLHMEERRESLRNTLVSALTYPAFLVVFSIAVVVFVLVVVFPKFGDLFNAIADQLPATTVMLLALSNLMIDHWPWLIAGTSASVWLLWTWGRSESGRHTLDTLKLRIPVVRSIAIQLYLTQVLRVLGLSINHGVPIVEALHACRESATNSRVQAALTTVEETVRDGGRISDGFDASNVFPELARQMLRTAEEAGNLGPVGQRLADYYERELGKQLDRFAKMIEPVMLLVMGGIVGVIVSSLVLPIFKLSQAVG